jgi:hypothetical protein
VKRPTGDAGNALIEFTYLAVLLMIPLVYVLLSAFQVQRAAFGVTEAPRPASDRPGWPVTSPWPTRVLPERVRRRSPTRTDSRLGAGSSSRSATR